MTYQRNEKSQTVMDNKRRRQHLKVGLVTKVFVGHDDRVRVVEV